MSGRDWSVPVEVDDLTVAFPANVVGTLLPPWDDIPEEFKRHSHPRAKQASMLFFEGGRVEWREGVDKSAARRQVQACLGSFEPKHEHKEAGVAWLLDMWALPTSARESES